MLMEAVALCTLARGHGEWIDHLLSYKHGYVRIQHVPKGFLSQEEGGKTLSKLVINVKLS